MLGVELATGVTGGCDSGTMDGIGMGDVNPRWVALAAGVAVGVGLGDAAASGVDVDVDVEVDVGVGVAAAVPVAVGFWAARDDTAAPGCQVTARLVRTA